jgi:predicted alpha/beta hydrolase family esterase
MKVLLIHCWGGNGRSCWSGWLHDELKKQGIEVYSPDLPNTNYPKLNEWLAALRQLVPKFKPEDSWVVVTHSLGGPTILRLLGSFGPDEKITTTIMVAAFAKNLGFEETKTFVDRPFDYKKARGKCDRFIIINSDNDPYIELSEGQRVANELGGELLVEKGAGHINEGAGFIKYERVLKIIQAIS